MDIKQLLEKMDQFAGQAEGQKPGDQWRGDDPNPPGKKLVGDSILKDLKKGLTPKTKEQELAEEWAMFSEEDIGTHPKRPARKNARHSRGHEPQPRYTTVKTDESMSDKDIELQDYRSMSHKEFQNAYKMTKTEWINKNQSLVIKNPNIKKGLGLDEAGSPAQQAAIAIAIAMKKAGKKPKQVDEGADTEYTVHMDRNGRERSTSGTIAELLDYFGYTLEVGKSYEHEKGRYKINMNPTSIGQLIDALNKAQSNSAANGQASTHYSMNEGVAYKTANPHPALQDPIVAKVVKQMRPGLKNLDMNNEAFLYFAYEIGKMRAREMWEDYGPAIKYFYQSGIGVNEGWESGPEEYEEPYDDADDAYDRQRQEKIDTEAEKEWAKLPKVSTYQCTGRGANMEPNQKFGPEFDTLEKALEYRAEIMKDPKTPHPKHIGINTLTRVVDKQQTNEGIESSDPIEGAVLDAVQELIQQGHTDVTPEVITNMVVAATSQPFLLKDLVDANKNSPAIQHYIDSINPSKVKFSSDILTVKNENPAKAKAQSQGGVAKMAAKAASRPRLGETTDTRQTPLVDKEDYAAKCAQLQKIQMDPETSRDPQLKAELARRMHVLMQQAKAMGIDESRARKVLSTWFKNHDLAQKFASGEVKIPTPQERRAQLEKPKKQIKEFGADQPQGTAGQTSLTQANTVDPKQAAAVTQATQALKSATQSSAPAPMLAKALDAASQGKPVGQQDMKALEPLMKDVATVAQEPKLAGQFKSLAQQIQQVQQKQQKTT